MEINEHECPLKPDQWINYLEQEKNIYYSNNYNAVVSNLTIMILLLTILNGLLIICMVLLDSFSDYPLTYDVIFICIWIVLIFIIIINEYIIFWKIPKHEDETNDVIRFYAGLITQILSGIETDSKNIRKKYIEGWENLEEEKKKEKEKKPKNYT